MREWSTTWLLIALLLSAASKAGAGAGIPRGYVTVATQHGLPPAVFFSIARAESGRMYNGRLLPWPWTLNVAGHGRYFNTRQGACMAAKYYIARGKSVDIGLMQIHWQTHHKRFNGDPCTALDPAVNMHAGAGILREEWLRSGNLWTAVGWYHSPGNRRLAGAYRKRVSRQLDLLEGRS